MAIVTETSSVEYTGNGATVAFAVPFPFLEAAHLLVRQVVDDVANTLVLDVDYTVSGVGGASGTVTLTTAPANGDLVQIERVLPLTQPTSFRTQGSFSPALHEAAIDRLTMLVQQLERRIDELSVDSGTPLATPSTIVSRDENGSTAVATLVADAVAVTSVATGDDAVSIPEGSYVNFGDPALTLVGTTDDVDIGAGLKAGAKLAAPGFQLLAGYLPTMPIGDSRGSPGSAELNTPAGKSKFGAESDELFITNSLVTEESIVWAQLVGLVGAGLRIHAITPGAGEFLISLSDVTLDPLEVAWVVIGPG